MREGTDSVSDSCASDSRASNSRASDSRAPDSRAPESRASESRASDSRASDSRASDSRASDSRASDSRASDYPWTGPYPPSSSGHSVSVALVGEGAVSRGIYPHENQSSGLRRVLRRHSDTDWRAGRRHGGRGDDLAM